MSKSHEKKVRILSRSVDKVEVEIIKTKVEKIVEEKPQKAAKVLTYWIHSKKKQKAS